MNCNRNSRALLAAVLVLTLAGCGRRAEEPVMSAPPPPPPPPGSAAPAPAPIYRVASGTPGVLERFPRGTIVTRDTGICLKAGEQITVTGSNGQSVTYTGPGCLKRSAPATPQNLGGFTFGWRAPADNEAQRAAK
jgi:hypothetical protein